MGKAAPVTTLCGQLAALKTQTFCVKVERRNEKKQSLSQEQSSKHVRCAEREHLCFTKVFGTEQPHRCRSHIWLSKNVTLPLTAMTERAVSQAAKRKVSHR